MDIGETTRIGVAEPIEIPQEAPVQTPDPELVPADRSQRGVTTVEYAVMLALIAIAVMATQPNISSGVINVFNSTASHLTSLVK